MRTLIGSAWSQWVPGLPGLPDSKVPFTFARKGSQWVPGVPGLPAGGECYLCPSNLMTYLQYLPTFQFTSSSSYLLFFIVNQLFIILTSFFTEQLIKVCLTFLLIYSFMF